MKSERTRLINSLTLMPSSSALKESSSWSSSEIRMLNDLVGTLRTSSRRGTQITSFALSLSACSRILTYLR